MKRIVLTGGGSAGHVIPALALLPELSEYEVHYVGSNGIEKDIVARYSLPFHTITAVKLRRSFSPSNLLIPFKLLIGIGKAKKILKKLRPSVIFSKGGFVSLPVVIAASRLNIPVIAHESDITIGLANKMAKKHCTVICTTFETTAKELGKKAIFTGNPLRESIYSGSKDAGLRLCGFENTKPMLLFIGGSLGSTAINGTVRSALAALTPKFNICHIVGKGNTDKTIISNCYKQIEFCDEIQHLLAAADVVISRAGANAVCEILALKKASLLIPLPLAASRGDQILNAKYFEERGLAAVLPQENMNPDTLVGAINDVYTRRFSLISALEKTASIDGRKRIAEIIKNTDC